MAWTDELKAQAVEMYTAEEPTPETSMEIVKMIADDIRREPKWSQNDFNKSWSLCKENSCGWWQSSGGTGGG